MNERIRNLKDKIWAEEYWTKPNTDKLFPAQLNRFAELIVMECADICMEMAAKCAGLPGDGALARDCADWIKKDFGVEE